MGTIYDIVAERLINRLTEAEKSGEKFYWVKPFAHGAVPYPCCYETGEVYKGINRVLLEPDEYTTLCKIKQHNEKHANSPLFVRKGAKSSIAVYFGYKEIRDDNGEIKRDEKGEAIKKPFLRYYNLFSRQDVIDKNGENIPSKFPMARYDHEAVTKVTQDEFLKFCSMANAYCQANGIELQIINDGTQCYYSPNENVVRVPVVRNFDSLYEYASAVAHELCHSTGIALNRFNENAPSVEAYSKEELIAEIAGEMLLANFQIEDDRVNKNNDIAYLQSWAAKLKNNPKEIVIAAQKAQKAAELISQYIEKEQSLDDILGALQFQVAGAEYNSEDKFDVDFAR